MAPRSAVELLPAGILSALNARLVDQSFSDYEGLTAWLQEQGYQISKTAVWRHGSGLQVKMEKSMGKARERMEIAKALRGASDDEKAALMEATEMVAMDQLMDMFEAASDMEEGDRMAAIPKLVRAIADLNRSAIGSAKWKKEFQADLNTKLAKLETEATVNNGSRKLDQATLKAVREEVYGLV
jgi:hypothetical protein